MRNRRRTEPVGGTAAARLMCLASVAACVLLPVGAGAGEAPASAEGSAEIRQLPRQDFSEPVLDSLRTSLEIYEELRAELAADRLEGLFVDSTRLAGALRMTLMGGTELAGETPKAVKQAVRAADSLAEVEDLDAARVRFGEVSRLLLLLGSADPRLTDGKYVFACPMAKGFHKWIQRTETMANPYMGPSMLVCGADSDWPEPASSSGEEVLASASVPEAAPAPEPSGPEPEFKPGIPGLKMVDVRDHKFLWREIEQLQMWERGDRVSVSEFRSKSIEKTAHFLGFSGPAADDFAAVASEAVAGVRDAFHRGRTSGDDPGGLQTPFSSELDAAVTRMTSLLAGEPRHQLFEPDCKKWLLKLAFGPRERDEAEEARQAARADADDGGRRGSGTR